MDCLEKSVDIEIDDQLLRTIIISTCNICETIEPLTDQGVKILDTALLKGGEFSMHAASEVFALDFNKLPHQLLCVIMQHLIRINPTCCRSLYPGLSQSVSQIKMDPKK